jgi:predicted chitinase
MDGSMHGIQLIYESIEYTTINLNQTTAGRLPAERRGQRQWQRQQSMVNIFEVICAGLLLLNGAKLIL